MAFKLNNGQITLNQVQPQEGKKLPSLKGKLKIFGFVISVVLWTKTTADGKKWWSGHIGDEAPDFTSNNQQSTGQQHNNNLPLDDSDCPF